MNKISWFLYLADVFQNLAITIFATIGVLLIVTGFRYLIWADYDPRTDYTEKGAPNKPSAWIFAMMFAMAIAAALLPTKNTMYMIAGSETAQTVVTSDTGKKVLDNLNKIILEYTKPEKK